MILVTSLCSVLRLFRVSTDKQTLETQRLEIEKFALNKKFFVDAWVSEIVSGTKAAADRKLGSLLKKMKKGDILIISEISRLTIISWVTVRWN